MPAPLCRCPFGGRFAGGAAPAAGLADGFEEEFAVLVLDFMMLARHYKCVAIVWQLRIGILPSWSFVEIYMSKADGELCFYFVWRLGTMNKDECRLTNTCTPVANCMFLPKTRKENLHTYKFPRLVQNGACVCVFLVRALVRTGGMFQISITENER